MEIINLIRNLENYQGYIRVTLDAQMIKEKLWYIVTYVNNGIGWTLEEMPLKNWLRLQSSKSAVEEIYGGVLEYHPTPGKGSVTVIKIPSDRINLETLKCVLKNSTKKQLKKQQF